MLGETISHYRILRKLGSGGMGVVYEAEDTTLGRKVALKFLPEHASKDPGMLARLQREARAASALNHPNICTIYAVEAADGHYFIAMELLEGLALDHLIAEKALSNQQIIDLGLQMCDALEAAHSKGIVHRDIKPANIFVTNQNRVKVLDFGLAKVELMLATASSTGGPHTQANTSELALTHPGTTMGTVSYMSPEQARGETLDARTDIFSLGVVLYQMATGKVPFEGTTSAVVFSKLLEHPPVSPIHLNPGLPTQLEQIINKTLEKDRDLRYQTAADVSADLRRLKRDSESRRSVTVAVAVPAPKAKRGSRIWVAVVAILLLALLGGGLYWIRARRATQTIAAATHTLTVAPLATIGDASNAYLSDGITREVVAKLAQLPNLHVDSLAPGAESRSSATGRVLSGSVVRSGDAVVVNTELLDTGTHQTLWNHQYTANTSELQALEGQIASDIAEHAGLKLGWEERQRLQTSETTNPEAYLLYLEARHEVDLKKPDDARKAADLLHHALEKDANFRAAADALTDLQKQFPDATQPPENQPEPAMAAKTGPSAERGADKQKHSAVKMAAVSAPPPPTPVTPAPAAPEMGTISVQSQPAGASILLDGKDTGKKTPAQIQAMRGAHSILLRQEGYIDSTTSANVKAAAETVSVSETLVKLGQTKDIKAIGGFKKIFGGEAENMGRVRIETTPRGAKVTVGTQVLSKPTPVEFDLNPGNYQITLEFDGYETLEKMVNITAGKKIQLKEILTKK